MKSQIAKDIKDAMKKVPITLNFKKDNKEKIIQKKTISHQTTRSTFEPVRSGFKRTVPGYQVIKVKSKQ
jgi:hypothetical protein